MYWRVLGGGHMLQVEPCSVNHQQIMWGLGYDWRVWIYSGGWGGAHFKNVDSSSSDLLEPVEDSKYYYVYENQRWNPLTGTTITLVLEISPSTINRSTIFCVKLSLFHCM